MQLPSLPHVYNKKCVSHSVCVANGSSPKQPHDDSLFIDHGWERRKFPFSSPGRSDNHILHVSFINYSWWCRSFRDEFVTTGIKMMFGSSSASTPLQHVTRNFYVSQWRKKPFCVILLVMSCEREDERIFNENHIRHGAGWQRHSHSSLLFIYFIADQTCSIWHLSTEVSSNRTWFITLSTTESFNCFFFVVKGNILVVEILPNSIFHNLLPLEWIFLRQGLEASRPSMATFYLAT